METIEHKGQHTDNKVDCKAEDGFISVEYIIKLTSYGFNNYLYDSRSRSAGRKTNCSVVLTPRILNKRINAYRWVKYAIVRITGPDDQSISQCLKLLEKQFPVFLHRKEYSRKANVTIFTKQEVPDNVPSSTTKMKTGPTMPYFDGLRVKSPFEPDADRPLHQTPWKCTGKEKLGIYYPTEPAYIVSDFYLGGDKDKVGLNKAFGITGSISDECKNYRSSQADSLKVQVNKDYQCTSSGTQTGKNKKNHLASESKTNVQKVLLESANGIKPLPKCEDGHVMQTSQTKKLSNGFDPTCLPQEKRFQSFLSDSICKPGSVSKRNAANVQKESMPAICAEFIRNSGICDGLIRNSEKPCNKGYNLSPIETSHSMDGNVKRCDEKGKADPILKSSEIITKDTTLGELCALVNFKSSVSFAKDEKKEILQQSKDTSVVVKESLKSQSTLQNLQVSIDKQSETKDPCKGGFQVPKKKSSSERKASLPLFKQVSISDKVEQDQVGTSIKEEKKSVKNEEEEVKIREECEDVFRESDVKQVQTKESDVYDEISKQKSENESEEVVKLSDEVKQEESESKESDIIMKICDESEEVTKSSSIKPTSGNTEERSKSDNMKQVLEASKEESDRSDIKNLFLDETKDDSFLSPKNKTKESDSTKIISSKSLGKLGNDTLKTDPSINVNRVSGVNVPLDPCTKSSPNLTDADGIYVNGIGDLFGLAGDDTEMSEESILGLILSKLENPDDNMLVLLFDNVDIYSYGTVTMHYGADQLDAMDESARKFGFESNHYSILATFNGTDSRN